MSLRVGLGCMRLAAGDEATVHAALDAGVTVFDTAHAYGNEQWLGRVLSGRAAFITTKGGLTREWAPDGRVKSLRAQCEASLEALGRIDLYLLHTVDPRVPWATSVRALEALRRDGLVRSIGVSNVTRAQLEEAASIAELSAVQLGVSVFDDVAVKSGVFERALELGLTVQCHSPLGGPRRAKHVDAVEALGALLALHEKVVVLPGATKPETIRASSRAVSKRSSKWWTASWSLERAVSSREEPGITMLMGVQGAGKTSLVSSMPELTRLNRDLEGGTLKALHAKLDDALSRGERGFVLDNTYVTRAQRYDVLRIGEKHGQAIHGRWLEVAAADAQVNIVKRMLEVHGRLLEPGELLRGATPDSLGPKAHFRTWKSVEVPELNEGFTTLTRVPFVRRADASEGRAALFVGIDQLDAIPQTDELIIVVGWKEGGLSTPYVTMACPHSAGPPTCWCRPPLPGLFLAAARMHGVALSKSRLLSSSASLRSAARQGQLMSSIG